MIMANKRSIEECLRSAMSRGGSRTTTQAAKQFKFPSNSVSVVLDGMLSRGAVVRELTGRKISGPKPEYRYFLAKELNGGTTGVGPNDDETITGSESEITPREGGEG